MSWGGGGKPKTVGEGIKNPLAHGPES